MGKRLLHFTRNDGIQSARNDGGGGFRMMMSNLGGGGGGSGIVNGKGGNDFVGLFAELFFQDFGVGQVFGGFVDSFI